MCFEMDLKIHRSNLKITTKSTSKAVRVDCIYPDLSGLINRANVIYLYIVVVICEFGWRIRFLNNVFIIITVLLGHDALDEMPHLLPFYPQIVFIVRIDAHDEWHSLDNLNAQFF